MILLPTENDQTTLVTAAEEGEVVWGVAVAVVWVLETAGTRIALRQREEEDEEDDSKSEMFTKNETLEPPLAEGASDVHENDQSMKYTSDEGLDLEMIDMRDDTITTMMLPGLNELQHHRHLMILGIDATAQLCLRRREMCTVHPHQNVAVTVLHS